MELKIAIFWTVVYIGLWFLKRSPNNIAAKAAFTWVGPYASIGEPWSSLQLRWAFYSFWWFCQLAIVFCGLGFLPKVVPAADNTNWLLAGIFASGLGTAVAAVATVGFVFKWLKAKFMGPNPTFQPEPPAQ